MSTRFLTAEDVHRYLDEIPKFAQSGAQAANFSLDSMKEFCKAMGNPQKSLKAIHVAGTNGKGTTCQMLASVYQQAGFKTGLYTSPHLNRFNERIRINARMIPDEKILEFFQKFESALNEIQLTYFEISTSLAFWYLVQENVEIAIIEAGLGGRLDATNVIEPSVSVITSVGLDHTDILGDTIRDIAREKAGIIKKDKPLVTGRLPAEAEEEIAVIARANNSEWLKARLFSPRAKDSRFELNDDDKTITIRRGKRKEIDSVNITTCWAVIKIMQDESDVSPSDFCSGIEHADERFPEHAHFQQLDNSIQWYFDGAHNAEAIQSMVEHLAVFPNGKNAILFFSMMKDKARPEVLQQLRTFSTVYYIDMNFPRSAPCSQIQSQISHARCFSSEEIEILSILEQLKTELVIFTGSFYFYSEVKKWMASFTPSKD